MKIKINRYSGAADTDLTQWKDLISSLVLCGYEVYGDLEQIVFELGTDDEIIGGEDGTN